jgi:hypothetical protein
MTEGIRFQNWAQARALWYYSNPHRWSGTTMGSGESTKWGRGETVCGEWIALLTLDTDTEYMYSYPQPPPSHSFRVQIPK